VKSIRLVTPLSLVLAATCVGGIALNVACGSDDDATVQQDAGVYVDGGVMSGLPSGPTGTNGGEGGIDTTMYDSSTGDATTGGGGNDSGLYNFDSGTPTDGGADASDSGEDAGDASADAGADAGDAGDAGDASTGGAITRVLVLRAGDTTTPINATSTALSAAYIDSIAVGTGTITNFATPASFCLPNVPSAGGLHLTSDGSSLTAGGMTGAAGGTVATPPAHAIITVGATGTVTSTALPAGNATYGGAGSAIRDVVSTNGTAFWFSGSGTSPSGVWYLAAGTATQVVTAPLTTRGIGIFGAQLYVSSNGSGGDGVFSVGSGLPVVAATSSATPVLADTQPYGFVAFDTDTTAGVDLAYVADSSAGVVPFRLAAGTWTAGTAIKLGPTPAALGAFSVTGKVTGTAVQLYATTYSNTNNGLYSLTDVVGTPSLAATLVVAAPTGEAFRGVSLAPTN
jgi:hypothetical protein